MRPPDEESEFGEGETLPWAVTSVFFMFMLLWRTLHVLCIFFIVVSWPRVANYKAPERSPACVARHVASVGNAAVCLGAAAYRLCTCRDLAEVVEAALPINAAEIKFVVPPPGLNYVYLILAAFSACDVFWALLASGTSKAVVDWRRLAFRTILTVTSILVCLVPFMPQMQLFILLQEMTTPCAVCHELLISFSSTGSSTNSICAAAIALVISIVCCTTLFNVCMFYIVHQTYVSRLVSESVERCFLVSLTCSLALLQLMQLNDVRMSRRRNGIGRASSLGIGGGVATSV